MWKKAITLLCIASLPAMLAWKLTQSHRDKLAKTKSVVATSDARIFKNQIRIQGDNWVGYLVFKSKKFQDLLAEQDIGVTYEIEPDFKTRAKHLADGTTHIAAMTIDAWVANGKAYDYPGVIGFVIDESTGGDAIIGGPGIKSVNDLNSPEVVGTFVGNSPSEFFLKSGISHFNLDQVKARYAKWRTDDIKNCLARLSDGSAQFAVLWEPQASEALRAIPGSTRILDTSQACDLVIDVGVFSRRFLQEDPALAAKVVHAYFRALHHLLNNAEEMKSLAVNYTGAPEAEVTPMLAGVSFASFQDNKDEWFNSTSTGGSKLIESISRISGILVAVGDFKEDPLEGNPFAITNRRLIGDLTASNEIPALTHVAQSSLHTFRLLSEADWQLKSKQVVGTLVDEPLLFTRGTAELEEDSQPAIRQAIAKLAHYPSYRVIIEAGVAPGNQPEDDRALSLQRAEAIRALFLAHYDAPARIHAVGLGSSKTPPRLPGESYKAWEVRCRYAKIYLAKP